MQNRGKFKTRMKIALRQMRAKCNEHMNKFQTTWLSELLILFDAMTHAMPMRPVQRTKQNYFCDEISIADI